MNARFASRAAAAALLLTSAASRADTLVDEATGTKFEQVQKVAGQDFTCLGAGVRKVLFFKAYAATFCLANPAVAKEAAAGKSASDLASDQAFFDKLSSAPTDKLVVMKLVRDISKEKIAGAFRESLADVLPAAKVDKLIATIPGDAKNGQAIQLFSKGNVLTIDIAGQAKTIDDAEIAKNLWRVWLGPKGVSPTLKESVAAHVGK